MLYTVPPIQHVFLDRGSYCFTNMSSIETYPQSMRHSCPGTTGQDKDAPRVDVFGLAVAMELLCS